MIAETPSQGRAILNWQALFGVIPSPLGGFLGGKLTSIFVCIMACKGTGEEVKLLNLAGADAPSPKAAPTHFTMSRCLSIFNFCLHLPLEF